eukprot:154559-Chlamydomonas_euryale.AAC.1
MCGNVRCSARARGPRGWRGTCLGQVGWAKARARATLPSRPSSTPPLARTPTLKIQRGNAEVLAVELWWSRRSRRGVAARGRGAGSRRGGRGARNGAIA